MHADEYDLILGKPIIAHPKRLKFLQEKWAKRKYVEKIQEFSKNKYRNLGLLDGQVVKIIFINQPDTIGIWEDQGDNGFHFFTQNTAKRGTSYYVEVKDVVYMERYPSPNVWRKINYFYWKKTGCEDRFHDKISWGTWGTECDCQYNSDGTITFIYTSPHGEVGSCSPNCQCRNFKNDK